MDYHQKAAVPPDQNRLSPENADVIIDRIEPRTLAEDQYYSAARAIELIENIRNGVRDYTKSTTIDRIKNGIISEDPLTESQKDDEYEAYLDEMERLGFDDVMSREDFLFYRDYNNIDSVIPDIIEMTGMERLEKV